MKSCTEIITEKTRKTAEGFKTFSVFLAILNFIAAAILAVLLRNSTVLMIIPISIGLLSGLMIIYVGRIAKWALYCLAEIAHNTETEESRQFYDEDIDKLSKEQREKLGIQEET